MSYRQIPFSQIIHYTFNDQLDAGMHDSLKAIIAGQRELLEIFVDSKLYGKALILYRANSLTHQNMYTSITNIDTGHLQPLYVPVKIGYNTFFYLLSLKYYPIYSKKDILYQHDKFRQLQNSYVINDMKFYYDILHAQANQYIDSSLLPIIFSYYYYRFHDLSYPVYGLDIKEQGYDKHTRFTIMSAYIIEQMTNNKSLYDNKLISTFPLNFETYQYVLKQVQYIRKINQVDYKYIPVQE